MAPKAASNVTQVQVPVSASGASVPREYVRFEICDFHCKGLSKTVPARHKDEKLSSILEDIGGCFFKDEKKMCFLLRLKVCGKNACPRLCTCSVFVPHLGVDQNGNTKSLSHYVLSLCDEHQPCLYQPCCLNIFCLVLFTPKQPMNS